jgi:transglycosylase-like protein
VPTHVPFLSHPGSPPRRAALGLVAAVLIATGAGAGGATSPALAELDRVGPQRAAIRSLEAEVIALQQRAGLARGAYLRARTRLSTLASEVRSNARALRSAIAQRRIAQHRLATRLVAIYREPAPPDLAELLLTTRSLSGALNGYKQLERIQQADVQVVRDLISARQRISRTRKTLLADRAEARVTLARAAILHDEAESLLGARRSALGQAQLRMGVLESWERRSGISSPATTWSSSSGASSSATYGGSSASGGGMSSRLAAIAWCESRNQAGAVSPDGRYRGKYQFHPTTWAALGGVGDPAAAPVAEQDRLAARLYAQTGGSAWPVCGRYGG